MGFRVLDASRIGRGCCQEAREGKAGAGAWGLGFFMQADLAGWSDGRRGAYRKGKAGEGCRVVLDTGHRGLGSRVGLE